MKALAPLAWLALLAAPLAAQAPLAAATAPPAPASPGPKETEVAPDSPRASLTAYLDLGRAGRFKEAARYLSLSPSQRGEGPELARRLKAVLDRHLWIDLDLVSPLPEGNAGDGLPAGTDEVGTIPAGGGRREPVRLVRQEQDERWVFSPGTVARIDGWYEALGDRFLREHLPGLLLRPGPRELLYWQWLALPLLLGVALLAGRLLGWASGAALARAFRKTQTEWDDALLARLLGPIRMAWTLAAASLLLGLLDLYAPAEAFLRQVLGAAAVLLVFWALWRTVDVAGLVLAGSAWGRASPSAQSVLSIGTRISKVVVGALGLIAALSQLGYPVASLLAGLGLGGLALALAAQKTVEHLFGSVALAVDQPFRVGDFVRIEDFVATVEAIGLRSTRFRTLDRTLVSIPNGKLAEMRLESFTARDRMRLATTIGLVYETTAAQMRQVLEGFEAVLRAHPKIWPDAVVVRFKEFAASSLDIEIMAWFETPEWSEFQLIRQEVLIRFMEVVERAGTSIAFPTRTVHLVREDAPRS